MKCSTAALFLVVVAANVAFMVGLGRMFKPRDLALAGGRVEAERVVARWREQGYEQRAKRALYLDYLFMACYGLTLWWGCVLARGVFVGHGWACAAAATRWAVLLVAIGVAADVLENFALLRMIKGSSNELWPRVTPVTVWLKFALPGPAVICCIAGLAVGIYDCVTRRGSGALPAAP